MAGLCIGTIPVSKVDPAEADTVADGDWPWWIILVVVGVLLLLFAVALSWGVKEGALARGVTGHPVGRNSYRVRAEQGRLLSLWNT